MPLGTAAPSDRARVGRGRAPERSPDTADTAGRAGTADRAGTANLIQVTEVAGTEPGAGRGPAGDRGLDSFGRS